MNMSKCSCSTFSNMPLAEGNLLILDCQATGANPETGHLMEMAWSFTNSNDTLQSYYFQLPEGGEIPRRISRITGIQTKDLKEKGIPENEIWSKLLSSIKQFSTGSIHEPYPTVIHFSRYEETFLKYLHRQYSPDSPFPFDIMCTHQLITQILPNLPSKGLRAIAGYFGYSVPELRRSTHHVEATAFIWEHYLKLIEEQEGIHTWGELRRWLDSAKIKGKSPFKTKEREFPMPREKRAGLPDKPGVYRMYRSNGHLLYIGKATSLKKRVNSYFHKKKRKAQARLTMEMLTQAADLKVTVTGSALEAALLETDEIKKNEPPYNVALKQGERQILFLSKDSLGFVDSRKHPQIGEGKSMLMGPLPSKVAISAFIAIVEWMKGQLVSPGEEDETVCALILGIPLEYIPEITCFQQGLALFKEKYPSLFVDSGDNNNMIYQMMKLGKELRRQYLAQLEAEVLNKNETEEEQEEGTSNNDQLKEWEPETVLNIMEGIIRHSTHLIRRARWFCLLSESVLTWEREEKNVNKRRFLVFSEGNIIRQGELSLEEEPPIPKGYKKRFRERQKNFDIMTYDRLRVLTTELRRLVSDKNDRHVQLFIRPGMTLNTQALIKVLPWV